MTTQNTDSAAPVTLSIVIPCFNEEATLEACLERLWAIAGETLKLELIVVDDGSSDRSLEIARGLAEGRSDLRVLAHQRNQGKGAALRTGFQAATGDFVCIQDADLEYDPEDLKRLVEPLRQGKADVVLGSRYARQEERRVLYFWHSFMNRALTMFSNMITNLDLTDMETCYKVFRRDLIQSIEIRENRFGFEPEIVAKIAEKRCRVFEMPVSYSPRTYSEGKKINWKDGVRALYCILHYGAHAAPPLVQFVIYFCIGATAAIANLIVFLSVSHAFDVVTSALIAFYAAAALNYWLCVHLLFRKNVKWRSTTELIVYYGVVTVISGVDAGVTYGLVQLGAAAWLGKLTASAIGLALNFLARKFIVFPEKRQGDWT